MDRAIPACTSIQTDLNGDKWCAVGCRVHHFTPHGCLAADHEVSCACGNFVCDHIAPLYTREDEGGEDYANICEECWPHLKDSGWQSAEQ